MAAKAPKYETIVKAEGEKAFFKELFSELFKGLKRYYGEDEAKTILASLKSKKVKIRNIETFCTPKKVPFEPSNTCYSSHLDLLDFIQRVLLECKEIEVTGVSYIPLTSFFVQAYGIVRKKKVSDEELLLCFRVFLTGLCSCKETNPYVFRIPDVQLAEKIASAYGINFMTMSYCRFIKVFLEACSESVKNKVEPNVEFLHILVEDYRDNIMSYLSETLKATKTALKEALADVQDFTGPENSKVVTRLDQLLRKSRDYDCILLNLKYIQENCKLRTYGDADVLTYILRKGGAPISFLNNPRLHVSHSFVSELELEKEFMTSYCEIEVDCSRYSTFEEASVSANLAVKLALLKYRGYLDILTGTFAEGLNAKVIFTNIQNLSTEFVRDAEAFRKLQRSKYMREVTFCYYFDEADCLTKFGFGEPKYLRVISDLHVDYSKNCYYTFNFGTDFVVNCGDTANDCVTASNWINENMTRGLVVPGNHMGYNYPFPELNGPWNEGIIAPENTRTEQLRYISNKLPSGVQLLNNSVYEYNEVAFLCTTLFTNFQLYGNKHKEECAGRASTGINDYRRIFKTVGNYKSRKVEPYTTKDTELAFRESLKFLEKNLKKYKDTPVVVVSHFAPLKECIHEKYAHDILNAYFVNDLSELIKGSANLRLWCFGHVHHAMDFIYAGTRVVAAPFGDGNENNYSLPYGYGTRISFEDIKSKKEWSELCKKLEVKG